MRGPIRGRLLLLAMVCFVAAACGGSGDDSSGATAAPPPQRAGPPAEGLVLSLGLSWTMTALFLVRGAPQASSDLGGSHFPDGAARPRMQRQWERTWPELHHPEPGADHLVAFLVTTPMIN
jgi:hypothetical protein